VFHFARAIIVAAAAAGLSFAAPDKEIVELQRDVALLQEEVRQLRRSVDEKMATLTTLVQQSVDAVNKSNTQLAVLEAGLRDRMAEQQKNLVAPVAGVTTKLDTMTTEFQAVRENLADLSERMNKLQTQIVDLSNTVKTIQSPPAPPPSGGPTGAAMSPPPGLSAKQLYDSALRDRNAGNFDLALQGFEEYLKYFGNTELAPNAQFYIGHIHYDKNDFTNAVKALDLVLEKYPENNKTADAMYLKGMALLRSNRRNEAAREFLNVLQQHPNSEVASKARSQRRALGLSVPAAPKKTTTRGR
jgi:tol-pal system protein YbgF